MERMLIVNGSPRAAQSHSKEYAALFKRYWQGETLEYDAIKKKPEEALEKLDSCGHLLLAFPLYADSLPATLLAFLKELARYPVEKKPVVHVLINCGFIEPEQNLVAVDMVRLFCKQNGYPYGMTLCIGSGEAILATPFVHFVKRKIRKFAKSIARGKQERYMVTMPISKKTFIRAAEKYWTRYGEKNHISKSQMATMEIEGEPLERAPK